MWLRSLYDAQTYYENLGWVYVDTPWVVDTKIQRLTAPTKDAIVHSEIGPLVGSAEQGFLAIRETLTPGLKYQSFSPCFRQEIPDRWHLPYFMKVELFAYGNQLPALKAILEDGISHAELFFKEYAGLSTHRLWTGGDTYDLIANGVEVGSYGLRSFFDEYYTFYGTGLAEPRMSQIAALQPPRSPSGALTEEVVMQNGTHYVRKDVEELYGRVMDAMQHVKASGK